jgi:P-type Cu+ transporter
MAHELATDPVCGMQIDARKAKSHSDYEGSRYYFCSEDCKRRFDLDPETYLASEIAPPAVPD